MKHITIILLLAAVSILAGCSKNNDGQLHHVRFVHFLTGSALPGEKIAIYKIIREPLSPPLDYQGTQITDKLGELSFNANGEMSYAVVSDTMGGPLSSVLTGSQGVMTDGTLTCELYPVTKLHFTHGAGNYQSASVSAGWSDTTRYHTGYPTDGASFFPAAIHEAEIHLVTHRPNTINVYVFFQDGTMKTFDQTITPVDFTPITLNIPY